METYFFDALSNIVSDRSSSSYWSHMLKHSNNAEILKYDRPYPVFISILKLPKVANNIVCRIGASIILILGRMKMQKQ